MLEVNKAHWPRAKRPTRIGLGHRYVKRNWGDGYEYVLGPRFIESNLRLGHEKGK